jgi:hypothetical protein
VNSAADAQSLQFDIATPQGTGRAGFTRSHGSSDGLWWPRSHWRSWVTAVPVLWIVGAVAVYRAVRTEAGGGHAPTTVTFAGLALALSWFARTLHWTRKLHPSSSQSTKRLRNSGRGIRHWSWRPNT